MQRFQVFIIKIDQRKGQINKINPETQLASVAEKAFIGNAASELMGISIIFTVFVDTLSNTVSTTEPYIKHFKSNQLLQQSMCQVLQISRVVVMNMS